MLGGKKDRGTGRGWRNGRRRRGREGRAQKKDSSGQEEVRSVCVCGWGVRLPNYAM